MPYDRYSAVNYAKTYALKPNPYYVYFKTKPPGGNDCANFISQCLHIGGIPMNFKSNLWYYTPKDYSPYYNCSLSWSVAHSLYNYLLSLNSDVKFTVVKDTKSLEVGDLIFYKNKNNSIFHSSIITSFDENHNPLISQHSEDALNMPIRDIYIKNNSCLYVKVTNI